MVNNAVWSKWGYIMKNNILWNIDPIKHNKIILFNKHVKKEGYRNRNSNVKRIIIKL